MTNCFNTPPRPTRRASGCRRGAASKVAAPALAVAVLLLWLGADVARAQVSIEEAEEAGALIGQPTSTRPPAYIGMDAQLLGPRIEWPMLTDPLLSVPRTYRVYLTRLRDLWVEALTAADAQLRIRVITAMAQAHREGMPSLPESVGPPLIEVVERDQERLAVRLAAAETLAVLDVPSAAEALWKRNQTDGPDMILLTDPALARWDHQPAREDWLARLADPNTPWPTRQSAIDALGTVGEARAAEDLRQIVFDPAGDLLLRMAAAEALGAVVNRGLVDAAAQLYADGAAPLTDRLMAAWLLTTHSDEAAQKLLLRMARDAEPAVAQIAVQRLLVIDPLLLAPELERLSANPDAGLRDLAVKALAAPATPDAVRMLADLLNDPQEDIRVAAREQLRQYEQQVALKEVVRAQAMRILAGVNWGGLVEAAELLGRLDHKPAADLMLKLLHFERAEVRLAAAVNLRRLAVIETMAPLLAHCEELAALWHRAPPPPPTNQGVGPGQEGAPPQPGRPPERSEDPPDSTGPRPGPLVPDREKMLKQGGRDTAEPVDLQFAAAVMAQIFQAFGQMDYRQADPLMRRLLPRKDNGGVYEFYPAMRAAGLWALGRFSAGKVDAALERECIARLNDMAMFDAEAAIVRAMAAAALVRMGSTSDEALGTLRRWSESDRRFGGIDILTCRWAVSQILDEPFAAFDAPTINSAGWDLEPFTPTAAR